jgi:hypothetical protein
MIAQGSAEPRELKQRIMDNAFARRMRELRIDRAEYARLCKALEELALHWRGSDRVDREVAGVLHTLFTIARDVIPTLGRADPRIKDEMEDMGIRLAALVRECFAPGPGTHSPPIEVFNTGHSLYI